MGFVLRPARWAAIQFKADPASVSSSIPAIAGLLPSPVHGPVHGPAGLQVTSADPFVVALAQVSSLQIVIDEKPTGVVHRPNIPEVVTAMGLTRLLDMIRTEKWVFGYHAHK
jgi:Domain of unknown function (DUF4411)